MVTLTWHASKYKVHQLQQKATFLQVFIMVVQICNGGVVVVVAAVRACVYVRMTVSERMRK